MKIDKDIYCKTILKIELDKWQRDLIDEETKNIVIRAGRQVGKSFGVSLKTFFYALQNPNKVILVIAASRRQSELLFDKITSFFTEYEREQIDGQPTKTRLNLKNGTRIYCVPAGHTGYSIRGYTVDLLIADEAAFIPEPVWAAIIPMLATTGGKVIMLSTPFGKGGYFYECFGDSEYRQFHLSSENCPRIPKEFLQKEKRRMSKLEYAQEYLGEFIEEFTQFFKTSLIKERCTFMEWNYSKDYRSKYNYYLGVDVARYGGDENAFVIIEMLPDTNHMRAVKALITSRISTADTMGRVIDLDGKFNFRKIFVDDQGVGAGVTDVLIEKLGRKVVGINNSSRPVDKEKKKRVSILKEDLYSNLLVLMEQSKIELIDMPELKRSLASIQFEYATTGRLRIYGNYAHIAEALVRAAWAIKAKGLKLFVA